MKKTSKTAISCILSILLLFGCLLPVFAENGPFDKDLGGWYPAFLHLTVLDQNDKPVMETSEYGFEEAVTLPLYGNGKAIPQDGAVYDKATNTLTLTDFHKGNYALAANMMGDDFTVRVVGDCRLSAITVWADEWGGSIRFTGTGSLTVNPNKTADVGVLLYPEYAQKANVTVDKDVNLTVYGKESPVSIFGGGEDAGMTADGKPVAMDRKKAVREQYVWVTGYSNPRDSYIPVCDAAADPHGFYGLWEWYDGPGDDAQLTSVTVERYVYYEEMDVWYVDYAWAEDNESSFPDLAAAAKAGYTRKTDEGGEPIFREIMLLSNYGGETVYADKDGNRYVVMSDFSGEEPVEYAYTYKRLPGDNELYVFTVDPGVDVKDLTEVMETVEYDDMFDLSFPGTEYVHKAGAPDDGPHFTPGDVDGDGQVTASDARLALRAAVGLETYGPMSPEFLSADVDGDEEVTASDARSILRAAVGLEKPEDWKQ